MDQNICIDSLIGEAMAERDIKIADAWKAYHERVKELEAIRIK
jgi:hypothetical protein